MAEMRVAAEKLDFEKAIELRDTIEALKQQVTNVNSQKEYERKKK